MGTNPKLRAVPPPPFPLERRLGVILVQSGAITREQLACALELQGIRNVLLGEILLSEHMIDDATWLAIMQKEYHSPPCNLDEFDLIGPAAQEAVAHLDRTFCEQHRCIPLATVGSSITVAMVDPGNLETIKAIQFRTGRTADVLVATPLAIAEAVRRAYGAREVHATVQSLAAESDTPDVGALEDADADAEAVFPESAAALRAEAEDAPVVKLVREVILHAARVGASDIHIETYGQRTTIRLRIDGILQPFLDPPPALRRAIISRVKVMARLDIGERRRPQDGRVRFPIAPDRRVELRVSIVPVHGGEESAVLRILDRERLAHDLTTHGFDGDQLAVIRNALRNTNGILLVTGPTGSGKTTTLYSALRTLADGSRKILTIEDPVEYALPGIVQSQVHEDIGYTFAVALRAFLRQDPDVILVGEIRDRETTETAFRAALTGHLVLSTLHTNDAASAVTRLLDQGAAPYLIATALRCVVAQRLIRKVCAHCGVPLEGPDAEYARNELLVRGCASDVVTSARLTIGRGCAACQHAGYHGRTAIAEVLPTTVAVRDAIIAGAPAAEIETVATHEGMRTLRMVALQRVADGVTTLEEALRNTADPV